MEKLNTENSYKPQKKIEVKDGEVVKSVPKKERKLFADPKYNKLLIAVGVVLALILVAAIVFVALPTSTFVK